MDRGARPGGAEQPWRHGWTCIEFVVFSTSNFIGSSGSFNPRDFWAHPMAEEEGAKRRRTPSSKYNDAIFEARGLCM